MKTFNRFLVMAGALTLLSGVLPAADGKLMHCFLYTPIESASQADWDAFYKATDALPSKIHSISKVWYGKLQRPMTVNGDGDAKVVRQYGVCMEMASESALKDYAKDPAHAAWLTAYEKVRVEGTTTFNLLTK